VVTRRRILIVLVVLLLAGGVGAYYVLNHGPGNVSNPNVQFDEEPTPTVTRSPGTGKKPTPAFVWTTYAYYPDRRRSIDVPASLVKPPFHKRWTYDSPVLLEFPPVLSAKSLFILRDDGVVTSIDKETGKPRWAKRIGALAASSPHLDIPGERLFLTVLSKTTGGPGRALAVDTKNGHRLWTKELPARTESSPILDGNSVYFGSEDGTVYALNAKNGATKWTYHAAGAVKSALALKDGKLFFGDYAGKVYALNASNGSLAWQAKTQGAKFGFASGRFYGNPAVAYGRVFIGNVDGYVYSFSAANGELAWRTKTNGYVYASPSVGAPPGMDPTVFIGSYDGTFYALDARSGAIRWKYYAGGKISGGSTLLGDTVWFADLANRRSFALDARNGKKVFEYPKGGYSTLVTDKKTLFLVGYGDIYALEPLSAQRRREIAEARRNRIRRAIERRRKCVATAKRAYTGKARRHVAFLRCVRRTNAIETPLHVIRERREARAKKG
jgi:outer membrane protein assembly factor BamB